MKDYFDGIASDFDSLARVLGTTPWADWAWRVVEKEIGRASGRFIVDLGSGTGITVERLLRFTRGARILGIDFSERMVQRARAKNYGVGEVEFRVSRVDRLRLPPQTVDYFMSYGLFHHVLNKRRVLRSLATMLRPGGKLINVDIFEAGRRYVAEMEARRRRHPEAAAQNDRIRQQLQWLYDQDTSHPREFHTDPYEFGNLLEEVGLKTAVHVSLQPQFAVVIGRKRRANA